MSYPPMPLDPPSDSPSPTPLDRGGSAAVIAELFGEEPEPRGWSGWPWLLGTGVVLALGLAGWWAYRHWQGQSGEPPVVTTAAVSRQNLENRVDASGTVTLGNQQTLKAPGDVTVEAVLVEAGQRVRRGTVLLRLRDRGLEQQLDEALIQRDILALERQGQDRLLQEKSRQVERAQDRLAESQELVGRGFISEDEYERDRDSLESAQAELRQTQLDRQKSELEMRKNQATLDNLKARMADNAILAPFDALVLNIKAQPGDGVPREGELLTLGDPAQERVIFELMALDARQVAIAMPVRVSMIGPNPQPFTGQVVSIAPQALSPGQDNTGDQATVQAIAQLDRPSGQLIPGSAVSVEVLLSQRQGVLAVPTTALQRDGQETYLWVVDGASKARRRTVQTGLSTLEAVEITQGLQEGDRVIATPPIDSPLSDGMAVSTPPAPALPAP